MGRIKTQLVKRVGRQLFKDHKDTLKKTFDENKQVIETLADIPSKKLRNIIAGYVTRLKQQEE